MIQVNSEQEFEHLSKAPIVEAVIEVRARAEVEWNRIEVSQKLREKLRDYSIHREVFGMSVTLGLDENQEEGRETATDQPQHREWLGYQIQTEPRQCVASFTRDGFSFSRLEPYEDWAKFVDEAMRLWDLHRELSQPSEVKRIGVRFINRLNISGVNEKYSDYLKGLPEPPSSLPPIGFFYRDRLDVPEYPYVVNLVRTSQPGKTGSGAGKALLLDIDVFSTEPTSAEKSRISASLEEMRWLKNHVFFESVTEKALELCR